MNQCIKLIITLLSTGAVEYTDRFSAEGYDSPTSVWDMTQNNLMGKFQ